MAFKKTDDDHLKEELESINEMVLLDSHTKVVDVEGTAKYRAELTDAATRGHTATKKGRDAFYRLMQMAETRQSSQIKKIALFLWCIWDQTDKSRFDLLDTRALDTAISDDILSVIDAIRWGKVPVHLMSEDLHKRMPKMLRKWGLGESDVSMEGN
jgi:hypothetical protein